MTDDTKPDRTDSEVEIGADSKADTAPETSLSGDVDDSISEKTIPPPTTDTILPPTDPLANTGARFGGRYQVLDVLGEGGMGTVYRAHDLELDEEIAIKVLQRQFTQKERDVERFKREIKTARKISHRNIIRIHDFGFAGRDAFISMEYLSGGTLADRIYSERLDYDIALDIAIQIAAGLSAAHAEEVVHRDIKPHNVLFDAKGVVKLVDFGIARFSEATSHTAGVTGTPHYMSPEQADGRDVNKRSDVYSLGILMFEMFTGERPFKSTSLAKLAMQHVSEEPPEPREIDPNLPPEMEQIILRCLAKDSEERFSDGRDLHAALQAIERGEKLDFPGFWPRRNTQQVPIPPPPDEAAPQKKRRPIGWMLIVLLLGAAFAMMLANIETLTTFAQQFVATPTAARVAVSPTPPPAVTVTATVTAVTTVTQTAVPTATPSPTRRTLRRTPRPHKTAVATPTSPPTPAPTVVQAPPPVMIPGSVTVTVAPWGNVRVVRFEGGNQKTIYAKKQARKFTVPDLEPGKYGVIIQSHPKWEPYRTRFELSPGEKHAVKFNFKNNGKLKSPEPGQ